MTEKRPFGLPSAKLVAIAAAAGLLAGAVAVYVKEAGSGNGMFSEASAECAPSIGTASAMKEFAKGEVAAMVPVTEARRLSEIGFKDGADVGTSLSAFRGKTVLVNLWATWCVPCREEMPALNALEEDMGGEDFQVVAINIDTGSVDKPRDFLTEIGVDALAFYRDETMGVFNAMKKEGLAFGLPVTLMVDAEGCLLGSMNGPAAWDSPDAKALVAAALGR